MRHKFSPTLICPKCNSVVTYDTSIRSGSCVCSTCSEKLKLESRAPNLITAIGVVAAVAVPLLVGARGVRLLILALILVVPSVFAVSFVLSFLIRPVLIVNRPREPRPRYRKPEVITTLFGNKKPK